MVPSFSSDWSKREIRLETARYGQGLTNEAARGATARFKADNTLALLMHDGCKTMRLTIQ